MAENCPSFSFLMVCYNQERYIAEALKSALAQNYGNLEIVVSDDNSSDRTFDIACEIAKNYSGQHKIILNRNANNLGIGANFQKAYSLSRGEWLVMAAGDDISYPNRCNLLCESIRNAPNDVMAICSTREIIDGDGKISGFDWWRKAAYGASTAWHRKLFEDFPPIPSGIMYEDAYLTFRLFYSGYRLMHTSRPTMQYRVDGISVTSRGQNTALQTQRKVLVMVERLTKLLDAIEAEMQVSKRLVPSMESWKSHLNELRLDLQKRKSTAELALEVMSRSIPSNIGYLFKDSSVPGHVSLRQRLGWFLRSRSLAYSLWCGRKMNSQHDLYKYAAEIPDNLTDAVVDAEDFLKGDFPVSF